jgi:tRNA(Ile)-lysidine synthase
VTIEDRVSGFVEAFRDDRWLVAVSGGADSVALLHLLVEQGFRDLVVCHLDHGLRGTASTEDAEFVKSLAAELGLECEVGTENVKRLMAERSESLETAARNARHAFFARCAEKFQCHRVLLAHHADDQAETGLWNLLRGSRGLKGMRERQDLTTESGVKLELFRPLLGVRRSDLIDWLNFRNRSWREDASNQVADVARNRLRHDVFPVLDSISGRSAAEMICRALEGARDLEEVEAWATEKAGVLDPQGRLHVPVLRALPPGLQRAVVMDYLRKSGVGGIDRDLISRVIGLMDANSPPAVNLPGGASMRRQASRMFIRTKVSK